MDLNKEKILEVKNIDKKFPGVHALKNIDFDLCKGEIHCLVGENGAGKSTFIEILSGSLRPDFGEIHIFNKKYNHFTPEISLALGIHTVHQEDILVESLSGAENIFLSDINKRKGGYFNLKEYINRSIDLLKSLNFYLNPAVLVEKLSEVEKKVLCIVKALWADVKILILDEPTQSLGKEEINIFIELVKRISSRGIGIIYISHFLDEIFKVGERITVLKDGSKISTHYVKDIDEGLLIKEMTGREFHISTYGKNRQGIEKKSLEIKNYSRKNVIKNISFKVAEGEIFGIGGMVGSGRTEFLRLIFGIDKRDSGTLIYNNKDITPNNPREAIHIGIGFLTEDRKDSGLILERSIKENILLAKLNITKAFFLDLKKEEKDTREIVNDIRIITTNINQLAVNLSGGNQQKVVLGKWFLCNSNILLLDEPTKGIDIGAKQEVYNFISKISAMGKIIIIVSSDMEELFRISDTIGIIREGNMINITPKTELSREKFLSYMIGAK